MILNNNSRVFAAEVLSNIMEHCVDSQVAAHFDLSLTRSMGSGRQEFLVTHLSVSLKNFWKILISRKNRTNNLESK